MIKLKDLILEKKKYTSKDLELANLSAKEALDYVKSKGIPTRSSEVFTDFLNNFAIAKRKCNIGTRERYDMPVINKKDVQQLQHRLLNGYIDVYDPYALSTKPSNPFPKDLSGAEARLFLTAGLRDGSISDDAISAKMVNIHIIKLNPIQKQIHFEKAVDMILKYPDIRSKLKSDILVVTQDDYILDGHHRFLTALLVNPKMQLQCLKVNLPAKDLIPLSLSYSDAIGNKRNT